MRGEVGILYFEIDEDKIDEFNEILKIPPEVIYYDVKAIVRTNMQGLISMMVTGKVIENYRATLSRTRSDDMILTYIGQVVSDDRIDVYLTVDHEGETVFSDYIGYIAKKS